MTTNDPYILIVDDERGFRELMTRILAPTGYRLRTASNAHEALGIIGEEPPAVAICDVHMPGPTGLWLAQQIRSVSPHTAMVLATSDPTVPPTESMRRGVVAYILKPYQPHAVLNAVAEAFVWWAEASGGEIPRSAADDIVAAAADVSQAPSTRRSPVASNSPRAHAPRRATRLWLRAALAILVAALLLAAFFYWKGHHAASDSIAHVATASGTVVVADAAGKPLMQGSGFFLEPDVFVTNRHVVAGGTAAKIVGEDGAAFRVIGVAAVDRAHDLVLLKTAEPSAAQLALQTEVPPIGTPISVYGAPLGLRGTLTTGIISTAKSAATHMIQISAPISHGSSGSPVVDADGNVVGVVVSSNLNGQGLNFAVPAADVLALLRHAAATMPLVVASRGAGDDRERYELLGPVRSAVVFAAEPLAAVRQRLEETFRATMPQAEAQRRAAEQALLASKTRLIFDRGGHLVEKTLGDDHTIVRYAYDESGRLAGETHLNGTAVVATLSFQPAGQDGIEASDPATGISHRVKYFDDGRVESEGTTDAGGSRETIHWTYDDATWPSRGDSAAVKDDQHDAMGNVVRRRLDNGDELRFTYRVDARGNWTSRDITRRAASGEETVVGTERRELDYWE